MITFTPAGRMAHLRRLAASGISLGLFTNADAGDTFEEPTAREYVPIRIAPGAWVLDVALETAQVPERGWTFTSDIGAVYGWFARGGDGQVEFFERFPQPITINQLGDQIRVAIEITPV